MNNERNKFRIIAEHAGTAAVIGFFAVASYFGVQAHSDLGAANAATVSNKHNEQQNLDGNLEFIAAIGSGLIGLVGIGLKGSGPVGADPRRRVD